MTSKHLLLLPFSSSRAEKGERRTIMGKGKKLKEIMGAIKDRASIIKTTLLSTRAACSSRLAVIRATTHGAESPPPEYQISAVISRGSASVLTASASIDALIHRLHSTTNASVALKCLIVINRILITPSLLSRHLSFYHSFLNLSYFRDRSSPESWELSGWVRWYAVVLEQGLSSFTFFANRVTSELLKEITSLGNFVEQVIDVPGSTHLRFNDLVFEVTRLVGEDYRRALIELNVRIEELDRRVDRLASADLDAFIRVLTRLEEYRERVKTTFVNRKKNDAFWEMILRVRLKANRVKMEKTMEGKDRFVQLTPFVSRIAGRPDQLYRTDRVLLMVCLEKASTFNEGLLLQED